MIMAIVALTIMALVALQQRSHWRRDHIRALEQELLFRGRQYVAAIDDFMKKNNGVSPESLDLLYKKKHIRQLYPDPMSPSGEWYLVMQPNTPEQKKLLVIGMKQLNAHLANARLVGVCSSSSDEAMMEYRNKKRYSEWAFFVGDDPQKNMPELEYKLDQP
jgi:hypothetical protein